LSQTREQGPSRKERSSLWRRAALAFLGVMATLVGAWSGLRFLAARGGIDTSSWAGGIAVFIATLVLFGLGVNSVGLFIRRRHPDVFGDLTKAFSRIAGGDFEVRVDTDLDRRLGGVASELNLMVQSLKRMEELRQEFISTASHEIQSPLTSIAGFAKALREPGLPEQTRAHYLSIIEDESGRLSRLSDGLLRLTSLESKGLVPELRAYPLDAQLRSTVVAAEPLWIQKNIELDLSLDSVVTRADENMMSQVWVNILHNALKFSPEGGRLSISLRLAQGSETGPRAVVSFADEGRGLAAEDLPLVFDRFFTADRSRSRSDPASGNGLGLAIAKKIVELHGGSIRAESPGLGAGSRFTVELPLEGPAPSEP
jgi:two-component system, OmpR family, phosphate regulon sensor histidine kinase PhoR